MTAYRALSAVCADIEECLQTIENASERLREHRSLGIDAENTINRERKRLDGLRKEIDALVAERTKTP